MPQKDLGREISPKRFISEPKTAADYLSNVRFQLIEVEGWMLDDFREGRDTRDLAKMKAECLSRASKALVAFLAKDLKKRPFRSGSAEAGK